MACYTKEVMEMESIKLFRIYLEIDLEGFIDALVVR